MSVKKNSNSTPHGQMWVAFSNKRMGCILQQKEAGMLGEMADSGLGAKHIQDDSEASAVAERKEVSKATRPNTHVKGAGRPTQKPTENVSKGPSWQNYSKT